MILHFLLVFLHILGVFLAAWHFARHFSEALRAVTGGKEAFSAGFRDGIEERARELERRADENSRYIREIQARIHAIEARENENETDLLTLAKRQGIMRDQPEPRD